MLLGGCPVGGRLRDQTRETRANRYFTDGSLPQGVIGAGDALVASRPLPRTISSPRGELWRLRLRFGWRWLVNRLTGHPEPKFPIFDVQAVGVILGNTTRRVLTLPEGDQRQGGSYRALPRVVCDGAFSPWEQLAQAVQQQFGLALEFQWVGLWEDPERAALEFIFAATASDRKVPEGAEWTVARNGAFGDRDMAYVERIRPTYARDPVWSLVAQSAAADMITVYKEAKL